MKCIREPSTQYQFLFLIILIKITHQIHQINCKFQTHNTARSSHSVKLIYCWDSASGGMCYTTWHCILWTVQTSPAHLPHFLKDIKIIFALSVLAGVQASKHFRPIWVDFQPKVNNKDLRSIWVNLFFSTKKHLFVLYKIRFYLLTWHWQNAIKNNVSNDIKINKREISYSKIRKKKGNIHMKVD